MVSSSADHLGEFRARAFECAVVVVGLLAVAVDDRISVCPVDSGRQFGDEFGQRRLVEPGAYLFGRGHGETRQLLGVITRTQRSLFQRQAADASSLI
jgi:hypothetical protein